ncbi:MAG: thioredoxin family protein [Pseudomonadota bacterium]
MHRRAFIASAFASSLVPAAAHALVDYTPGMIQEALSRGETVFVDYSAVWCSTCRRQERVLTALRAENPAYDQAMTFVKVDWDTYKSHEVTTSRAIPRRSTLLVLRGDQELGRIVAGTSQAQIKELLDLGL